MSVAIVNDYDFKPDGDVAEGKAAAADLVAYFKEYFPQAQLSLWLEDTDNPLHHYHITRRRDARRCLGILELIMKAGPAA